jgi:hypothetical protein
MNITDIPKRKLAQGQTSMIFVVPLTYFETAQADISSSPTKGHETKLWVKINLVF